MVHPQVETDWGHVNPIGPRAWYDHVKSTNIFNPNLFNRSYDEAKRMAETLTFDFHRTKGTDIRVVRIFNTYGPRMTAEDGRVVSNFIVQKLDGQLLTVYGEGKQTRSFCYVSDLVEGIVRLMNTPDITGPVNIGTSCLLSCSVFLFFFFVSLFLSLFFLLLVFFLSFCLFPISFFFFFLSYISFFFFLLSIFPQYMIFFHRESRGEHNIRTSRLDHKDSGRRVAGDQEASPRERSSAEKA